MGSSKGCSSLCTGGGRYRSKAQAAQQHHSAGSNTGSCREETAPRKQLASYASPSKHASPSWQVHCHDMQAELLLSLIKEHIPPRESLCLALPLSLPCPSQRTGCQGAEGYPKPLRVCCNQGNPPPTNEEQLT